jgi:hypothetical protein
VHDDVDVVGRVDGGEVELLGGDVSLAPVLEASIAARAE